MKLSSRKIVGAVALVGFTRASLAWAQTDATVQMVYPRDAATEVAPNTGLALRFKVEARESDEVPSELVSLRNERGEYLALGEVQLISEEGGLQVLTQPLALAANSRYEVLTRVTAACDDDATLQSCLASDEDAVVVAAFTTGEARDETAPSIVDAMGEEVELLPAWRVSPCLWQVNVDAEDDQAPAAAIRYEVDGAARARAQVVLTNDGKLALELEGGAEATKGGVTVTPIDPSGNRGKVLTLDVPECPFVDNGGEGPVDDFVDADDVTTAQTRRAEGCSVTHGGAASTGAGALSAVMFFALALGATCVRRQRR